MGDLNYHVLAIFAPVLILVGAAGFLLPQEKSPTSAAPAYNIFHIVFGFIGVLIVMFARHTAAVWMFNLVFGLLDLYQAGASYLGLPPKQQFRWKKADDILHVVIGLALVLVSVLGS